MSKMKISKLGNVMNKLVQHKRVTDRDVEAVKFLMLPLPAPLEVLCF